MTARQSSSRTRGWASFALGAVLLSALTLCGCTSPVRHAATLAANGQLHALVLPGADGWHHQAYAREAPEEDLLIVFVEGDGSPWTHGGTRIATDPSPKHPIALKLAANTPGSVLYLGRPCYLQFSHEPGCSSRLWTSDRYSSEVVASMNDALKSYLQTIGGTPQLLLIGYSGGGTIVALMARDLPDTVGLVTIAGNLDPDEWTRVHHFVPLSNSVNPTALPPLSLGVRQWHLIGTDDTNVPYEAARRYLERPNSGEVWAYKGFDHTCCWEHAWPHAFAAIKATLAAPATRGVGPEEAGPEAAPAAHRRVDQSPKKELAPTPTTPVCSLIS